MAAMVALRRLPPTLLVLVLSVAVAAGSDGVGRAAAGGAAFAGRRVVASDMEEPVVLAAVPAEPPAEETGAEKAGGSVEPSTEVEHASEGDPSAPEHPGEEAEHTGEGEAGGHGHGHHAPSVAYLTTSYMLVGFLFFNFTLYWLLNWPDANVRKYTWGTLNSTISIYLAVVLNNSLNSIALSAVSNFNSEEEDEQGEKTKELWVTLVRVFVHTTMCVGGFALINASLFRVRESKESAWYMYAIKTIGGHIIAFAGIGAFQALEQGIPPQHHRKLALFGIAFLFLLSILAILWVSQKVRRQWLGTLRQTQKDPEAEKLQSEEQKPRPEPLQADSAHHEDHQEEGCSKESEWVEAAVEAEEDASAIVLSFLAAKLTMVALLSEPEEGTEERPVSDILTLAKAEAVVVLVLSLLTYGRKQLDQRLREQPAAMAMVASGLASRASEGILQTVAMCMSWLAVHLSMWSCAAHWRTVEHHFIAIISAAILTVLAIVGIILLDLIADKVVETPPPSGGRQAPMPTVESGMAATLLQAGSTGFRYARVNCEQLGNAVNAKNLEKAIRAIIGAFALSVGLAWEHAFHAASQTIVDSQPSVTSSKILPRMIMVAVSFALMMPVWIKFIVPMAKKSVKQHTDMMKMEEAQRG